MTNSLNTDRYEFNLSTSAKIAIRRYSYGRFAGFVIAIFLIWLGFWLFQDIASQGVDLVIGVTWVVAGYTLFVLLRSKPPVPLCAVTLLPEEVRLRFGDGTELNQQWTDPKFRLLFWDFSIDSDSSRGEAHSVRMIGPDGWEWNVPSALADVLIRAAKTHSLPVLVRIEFVRVGRTKYSVIATHIGDLEHISEPSEASRRPRSD